VCEAQCELIADLANLLRLVNAQRQEASLTSSQAQAERRKIIGLTLEFSDAGLVGVFKISKSAVQQVS
jgi:hypothetical protein